MKAALCYVALILLVVVAISYARRRSAARNEANGTTEPSRFRGYKASLKTPINHGTPQYDAPRSSAS